MVSTWQFDTETRLRSTADGAWTTEMSDRWNIGTNPNGGYAIASSLRAMGEMVGPGHVPLSVTTHFLRPALGGRSATVEVEVIKRGRRLSVLRSFMSQAADDSPAGPRLTCLAAFGSLPTSADGPDGPTIDGRKPDDIPDPDSCLDRSELAQGVELPIMSRLDIRLDPATSVSAPDPSGPAAMRGWIRFGDGRPCDALALPLFADAFPPSLFSRLGRVGWVPTVELTVHVRRRPEPDWIQASFETNDLGHGLVIEDGVLWDVKGNVVAQSRQLAVLL